MDQFNGFPLEDYMTDIKTCNTIKMLNLTNDIKLNMLQTIIYRNLDRHGIMVLTTSGGRSKVIMESIMNLEGMNAVINPIHNGLSEEEQDNILEKFNNKEVEVIILSYDLLMSLITKKKEIKVENVVVYDLPACFVEGCVFKTPMGTKKIVIDVLFDPECKIDIDNFKYLVAFFEQNGEQVPPHLTELVNLCMEEAEDEPQ